MPRVPTPTEIRHAATRGREGADVGGRVRHVQEIPQDEFLPDALANSPRPTNSPRAREGEFPTGDTSTREGGDRSQETATTSPVEPSGSGVEVPDDLTVRETLDWVAQDPDTRTIPALDAEHARENPRKGVFDALDPERDGADT